MVEVQEIIKKYGKEYKEQHKMMPHIAKAMGAIEKCRTAELGYHEDICDECGYKKIIIYLGGYENLRKNNSNYFTTRSGIEDCDC